jgi:hypothetical protein
VDIGRPRIDLPAQKQDGLCSKQEVSPNPTVPYPPCRTSATFFATLNFFGWSDALLHTGIVAASSAVLVEVLLVRFRKIPFTCSYPRFESHSGVILVAYRFGFFVFTGYLPELEHWSLINPVRTICFVFLFGTVLGAARAYRRQMLEIDKQLIFEESASSSF